jgi:predicted Zn-dependent protease
MRTKGQLDDYLDGLQLLSSGDLFDVDSTMNALPARNTSAKAKLSAELDRFRAINAFVTTSNHLYPSTIAHPAFDPAIAAREDSELSKLGVTLTYANARKLAFAGRYDDARLLLRRLLRDAPADNDSRALLGRTYSWNHDYKEARAIFSDLVKRAPDYSDGYAALIDVNLWDSKDTVALALAMRAYAKFPHDGAVVFGKAKALAAVGRDPEALAALDELTKIDPAYPDAGPLRARLQKK